MPRPSPSPAPAPDRYRYERKYHLLDVFPGDAELIVKLHPMHFRVSYPPREVNNVYFDTPELSNFANHVNGACERHKMRIRWYGASHGVIERPVLEQKTKRGHVSLKPAQALGPFVFDGRVDAMALCDSVRAHGANAILLERLLTLRPVLFNRYRRCYYVSADGQFRATIDTDLTFASVNGWRHNHIDRYQERRLTVLELKYSVAAGEFAERLKGELPFRLSKLSKYVYGIQRLNGWTDGTTPIHT